MNTHWTLAQTLQKYGQKVPALVKASGVSRNTVYDIVNGKSQGMTLETVDKLLDGLERLTGQRMTIDAVLDRQHSREIDDPELLAQLHDLAPFDLAAVKATVPHWTPEEKDENRKQWLAHEYDRRSRGNRREQQLDALWEELDANDTDDEATDDAKKSA